MWRQEAYKFGGHPLNDEQGANMTDLRKAAEMALAKFEHLWEIGIDAEYKVELLPEIKALRQAIEQAEKQEPVAWMVRDQVDGCRYPSALKNPASSINGESKPLYTAPPKRQWVGLTDEEIDWILGLAYADDMELIKTIETKLKDKNG
jgi:hypothetical protein